MARQEGLNLWTPKQRTTLLVLLAIFILLLILKAAFNRQYFPDPLPPQSSLSDQLQDQLDPNTATQAELIVLPQLGEKRVLAILEFRDRQLRRNPTTIPFRRADDLLHVTGIGPAMLETFRPHLKFPASTTRPTSAPAGG